MEISEMMLDRPENWQIVDVVFDIYRLSFHYFNTGTAVKQLPGGKRGFCTELDRCQRNKNGTKMLSLKSNLAQN